MTLTEVMKDDFRLARAKWASPNVIPNLIYIRELCSLNSIPPDSLQMDSFTQEDAFLDDRADINKAFFEFIEAAPTKNEIDDEWATRFKASMKSLQEEIIGRRIGEVQSRAEEYSARIQRYRVKIAEETAIYMAALGELKSFGVDPEFTSKLADLNTEAFLDEMRNPFWNFLDEPSPGVFKLITPETVISYPVTRTETGKVNLGRFLVNVETQSRGIHVKPEHEYPDSPNFKQEYKGIQYAYAWHPFLHPEGLNRFQTMCYGEESSRYDEMNARGEMGGMLALTRSVLTHYNPQANPYRRPERILEEVQAYARAQSRDYNIPPKQGYAASLWRYSKHEIQTHTPTLSL